MDGKICFNCALNNFRLAIQQLIKEEGLKSVQIIWEKKKAEIEAQFRQSLSNLERTNPTMARTVRENMNRMIETIEGDLYPERKKQEDKKNEIIKWVIIGGVVIVVAVIIGVLIYLLCKKKKK